LPGRGEDAIIAGEQRTNARPNGVGERVRPGIAREKGQRKMVKDKLFYRTLLAIAIPTALQGLVSLSVNMLDNIMVGSLGDVSLASVSLANQITVMLSYFVKGVSGGAAALVAQYWGKKDIPHVKQVFSVAFQICFYITALLCAVLWLFPRHAMQIFSSDPAVLEIGAQYVRILCFSYLFSCVSELLIMMLRCVEVVRIGLVVSGVSLFSNLFFNYALIFGHFGFPRLETRGAALATTLSRFIELLIVLFYVFRVDRRLRLRVRELWCADRKMVRDYLHYGLPVMLGDVQWGFVGFLKNAMIGHMGVLMTASNSIAETVFSLFYVFITGLSSGACVLVGKLVGEGEHGKVREASGTIQILFIGTGLVVCAAMFFSSPFIPLLYGISAEARALSSQFIAMNAFMSIGTCYHAACFTGINRGAGDGLFVMKVDMICGWLVVLPLVFLSGFVLHAPLPAVYVCTRIDQCFKWLIAFIRLRGNRWIHDVTRAG
jgi:putative MATE family efflux protein